MSKKKKNRPGSEEETTKLPQFSGFHPLAGLKDFKAKISDAKPAAQPSAPSARPQPRKESAVNTERARASSPATPADDDLTFARLMGGVRPLDDKHARVPVSAVAREARSKDRPDPAKLREQAEASAAEALDHLRSIVDDGARFEVTDDGKRVEGRRVDTPPNLLRTLRRGQFPIDGTLDLHGLAAETARERVLTFLEKARASGERCVLVIHGKGEHSATPGSGVLRGEISAWLSQGRARHYVAAFATASDHDGGEGAVYVALRR